MKRLVAAPEDVAWVGVAAGGILLAAAIAWLAPVLDNLYPSPGGHLFPEWDILVKPEPLEEVRSMLALATPFVLVAAVLGLGRDRPERRSLDPLVLGTQVVLCALLVVAVVNQARRSGYLPEDYFEPLLLSVPVIAIGVVIGVLLTVAAVRRRGRAVEESEIGHGMRPWWIAFGLAVLATALFLLPAVTTDGTVGETGPLASGHIPVQGEDYFAVVNGLTPLVDYIAQYANLLPLALEPVLKAFGTSITTFSVSVCVLSGLGMLAIFGVFGEVTRRPWAALGLYVPWVALSLFPWNDAGAFREFNGNYYGVLPGRYLGPFLLAWLIARSVRRPVPTWAQFGFGGLVAVNNWEFGSAALLALVVAQLAALDRSESTWRDLGRLAAQAIAGLLAAVVLVCAITLLRAGQLPDPSLLTYFSRLFLRDAYGLEPMPFLGLHWALYATYLAALLVAAIRFVRRDTDRVTTVMLAFSGTFGLATAMYFVGRSSQFQVILLFPAWGLSLALLARTALLALRSDRGDRPRLRRAVIPACAALIGFGVMVAAIGRVSPPWRQIDRLSGQGHGLRLAAATDYIRANAAPGEHVLIMAALPGHLVADRAGVIDESPINGLTSLISSAEADRAVNQLQDAGGTQVFDGASALPEFARILQARGYVQIGEDPASGLRLWRAGGAAP
jgi:hypothetical protein